MVLVVITTWLDGLRRSKVFFPLLYGELRLVVNDNKIIFTIDAIRELPLKLSETVWW